MIWLGYFIVLIEIDGWCVFIDLVWGQCVLLFMLMGLRCFQFVLIVLCELLLVDVVVILYDYYDYLDYFIICVLVKLCVFFIMLFGVGVYFEVWGIVLEWIIELVWWDSYCVFGIGFIIIVVLLQYFFGCGLKDCNFMLWLLLVIEGECYCVFFSGDIGFIIEYVVICDWFGLFDLVMLEVGVFYLLWGDIYLGLVNVLQVYELFGGGVLMFVYWGIFVLFIYVWDELVEILFLLVDLVCVYLLLLCLGEFLELFEWCFVQFWW